jgi:hypothetical protein
MTRLTSTSLARRARWAFAALATVLAACGGGGGGSDPAPPPATAPAPAPGSAAAAPTVQIGFSASQVTLGQTATLSWSATNASSCVASGSWSGPQPTSGSVLVAPPAVGFPSYALACTGPGGTASAAASLSVAAAPPTNTVAMVVNRGPRGESFNMPFVSVTVCSPGTASCRTIDHVLVDSGSTGLRVMAATLGPVGLPAVNSAGGAPVGSCGQFASGFTWGSLRRADVRMGGEVAVSIPVQVISDPAAAYSTVPIGCQNTGADLSTVAALGANGILGVSQFAQDCGRACVSSAAPGLYYACGPGGCTSTSLPLASQVANPVPSFAVNNNGLALSLPAVPPGGASNVVGTLTFGIGTQPNNRLDAVSVYATDQFGNFTTVYKGTTYPASFIDSGSNGIFFTDPSLPLCPGSGFYCPPTPLTLSAENISPSGARSTVNFTIEHVQPLTRGASALNVGGSLGLTRTFDWGLPFFFGRTVFVGIEGAATPKGDGPFWAY